MITPDGSSIRIIGPEVSDEAVRQAVLDEDGHIRELPASEWRKFEWDSVVKFMHNYPVYVLPTTELLDVLDNLTADYEKTIEIGAGTGSIGRLLGIKMTDSHLQADKKVQLLYALQGQPVIKYPPDVVKLDALTACRRFKPDCVLGCYVTHLWREGMSSGNMYGVDFERLLPQLKRLILVGNLRTHADNPIMGIDHMELDLHGDLITRSDEPELNRVFVWDNN